MTKKISVKAIQTFKKEKDKNKYLTTNINLKKSMKKAGALEIPKPTYLGKILLMTIAI
jgi:hypothetical protein